MKYRFYIYRETFLPGGSMEVPEERVIDTSDPKKTAKALCKGAIHRVDWEKAK